MNCKQGDLAIVVRSSTGIEGKIVRCVRFLGEKAWMEPGGRIEICDTWQIDQVLQGWDGDFASAMPDDQLLPIRDPGDDAKDEMLRPLPHEVTA